MVKNPRGEFRSICEWALSRPKTFISSFSLLAVIELRRRSDIYEKFLNVFRDLPCVVLKGHEELLEDEVASYPDPRKVSALSVGIGGSAQAADCRLDRVLELLFSQARNRHIRADCHPL
jgi:hypothetical protein